MPLTTTLKICIGKRSLEASFHTYLIVFSFYKALSVPVGRSQWHFINMKWWNASQNMSAIKVSLLKYEGVSWVGKESACNAGDPSWIPGLGRSHGEGKGYPLQYSNLKNSMDCIVHGIAKSQTQLNNFRFLKYDILWHIYLIPPFQFLSPKYLLVFKAYSECRYDCCDKTISQIIACKLSWAWRDPGKDV